MYRNNPPVEINQELEVKIVGTGEKGDGIAKVKGYVIFVPNAKLDEVLKVKITKVFSKISFAEIMN